MHPMVLGGCSWQSRLVGSHVVPGAITSASSLLSHLPALFRQVLDPGLFLHLQYGNFNAGHWMCDIQRVKEII